MILSQYRNYLYSDNRVKIFTILPTKLAAHWTLSFAKMLTKSWSNYFFNVFGHGRTELPLGLYENHFRMPKSRSKLLSCAVTVTAPIPALLLAAPLVAALLPAPLVTFITKAALRQYALLRLLRSASQLRRCFHQTANSASVVDCATEDCFREDQQTREDPRKWQVPEVLFRSIPQPAKSASK
jgi:hypothetical protein